MERGIPMFRSHSGTDKTWQNPQVFWQIWEAPLHSNCSLRWAFGTTAPCFISIPIVTLSSKLNGIDFLWLLSFFFSFFFTFFYYLLLFAFNFIQHSALSSLQPFLFLLVNCNVALHILYGLWRPNYHPIILNNFNNNM